MDDKKIIALFTKRAWNAIAALQKKYGALLQSVAANILSDRRDAQECVNDTYMAVWNRIPPEQPDPLCAYVCRITRNIALKRHRDDHAQKRNSQYDLSLDELADCLASTPLEETMDARELGRAIDAFLRTLSAENRIIFLRRHWFGDNVKEIAASLSMSESTISVRLHRTRSQLKAYLTQEGYL